jgi:hypothetical protein
MKQGARIKRTGRATISRVLGSFLVLMSAGIVCCSSTPQSAYEKCQETVRKNMLAGKYNYERWEIANIACEQLRPHPATAREDANSPAAVQESEFKRRLRQAFEDAKAGKSAEAPKLRGEVRKQAPEDPNSAHSTQ